ncbi:Uncharacterised protein [Vibrio cholerae]|nr:Uncharacterised protein [Vibrio cholerae]CSD00546.1 Uncharacterised protein [Vibrio cholerae]
MCGSISIKNSMPFSWAFNETTAVTLSSTSSRLKSIRSTLSLPASILEKSRMSLMMPSKFLADSLIRVTYLRCVVSSGVFNARCAIPKIAFIGVRISWLIFAKKSPLA